MTYCIDNSALVDLGERYYPEHIPVFAPIWAHLYENVDSGQIFSVWRVQQELEAKADEWRKDFIKKTNGMFLNNEEIEEEFGRVVAEIENSNNFPANKAREKFFAGADPWVIATARVINKCTVISGERKNLTGYGLAPVCKELGVKHMSLVEYFSAANIGAN